MKKPKKNEKRLHQKRSKKAAKRKKILKIKQERSREIIEMMNKMTDEELRNYIGDEAYKKLVAEVAEVEEEDNNYYN